MSDAIIVALIGAAAAVTTVLLQLRGQRHQRNITSKVDETHRQVTINQHSSEEPTILDKLDDLTNEIRQVRHWQVGHDIQHEIERKQDRV